MRVIVMSIDAAILVGWSMIAGLRIHLFLERFAPQLAAIPFTRNKLVLAGLVAGATVAARSLEFLPW
jgi:hypothetical protein